MTSYDPRIHNVKSRIPTRRQLGKLVVTYKRSEISGTLSSVCTVMKLSLGSNFGILISLDIRQQLKYVPYVGQKMEQLGLSHILLQQVDEWHFHDFHFLLNIPTNCDERSAKANLKLKDQPLSYYPEEKKSS
ncbi:hypothetical protein Mapa_012449 [Marchantia paleacea]|nr:hypothetical protein Mapa_012449 [Marchantia paleacea]